MSCNLEYAVSGGIDNQIAGEHMSFTVIVYYLRSRIRLVAQDSPAGYAAEFIQYFIGKAVGKGWQRLGRYDSRHFPMTDGGILAV